MAQEDVKNPQFEWEKMTSKVDKKNGWSIDVCSRPIQNSKLRMIRKDILLKGFSKDTIVNYASNFE